MALYTSTASTPLRPSTPQGHLPLYETSYFLTVSQNDHDNSLFFKTCFTKKQAISRNSETSKVTPLVSQNRETLIAKSFVKQYHQ
jgi:hypothetical protein